ncbi:MAG: protein kinase [Candidatus Eremiobacterota bacterium]
MLELHPFLFPGLCTECQRTHIFIFDYIYSDKVNYTYPVENHRLPCTSVKKDLEQIVARSIPLRKQIYYEDLWIESRSYREKNLAEKYRLLELVGSGGMGDVYKALQINLGTIRAIKILPQNLCGNLKYIKRFEREARLAARLEHENIVRVIDVGETDLERYIVMEYIEGKTLRDVLNERETLPEEEVISLATAIASGLSWIHQNDIIHRDIKPENIMIDINGKVKIADFGISKSTGSPRVTAVGAPIGTAQYLSPEQASGHGEVGFYSDIYSLGIVLYEMMTGHFPYEFKDDNPFSIAYTIINTDVIPIKETAPGISSNLASVVMKCLEKDPKRRYADAQEILKKLKNISEKNNEQEEATSPFLEGLRWSGKSTQEIGPLTERHAEKVTAELEQKNRADSDCEIRYSNLVESVLSKGFMTEEEKQIIKSAREHLNISSEQNIRIFSEAKGKYKEKIDRARTHREGNEETAEQKVKACIKKGNEYYDRKNYNSAIKEFKAALEISDSPDIHNSIGAAYCLLGRYDMAIIEFEASLKLDRNNALAIRNLNHIYGLKKRNITRKMYGDNGEEEKNENYIDKEKMKMASNHYRQFLERLWTKTYITDKEQQEIELMKKKLNLSEDISQNIEREVERENEDRIKARETYRLDVMDMAITSYTTLLENLWNKGYLTEEDKKYMKIQKEEYNLPADISEQIEKDVETALKAKDKERIEKALKGYRDLLNDYWRKGFLSLKEKEALEKYRVENRVPDEKILSIEKDIKNRYYKNKIELAINKEGPDQADIDDWPLEDYTSNSSFVSREKELEELLSYAMSSDKMEQDMAFWALLNTFETLIKELNAEKRDWATPSFVKSLRKAKHIIPKEKARLISLIDNIFKGLTRSTRRFAGRH